MNCRPCEYCGKTSYQRDQDKGKYRCKYCGAIQERGCMDEFYSAISEQIEDDRKVEVIHTLIGWSMALVLAGLFIVYYPF